MVWRVGCSCLFWMVWKIRNGIAFRDELLSVQMLKASFVFILWSETKLNIVEWTFNFIVIYWLGGM